MLNARHAASLESFGHLLAVLRHAHADPFAFVCQAAPKVCGLHRVGRLGEAVAVEHRSNRHRRTVTRSQDPGIDLSAELQVGTVGTTTYSAAPRGGFEIQP
jgi:hypothetical protein